MTYTHETSLDLHATRTASQGYGAYNTDENWNRQTDCHRRTSLTELRFGKKRTKKSSQRTYRRTLGLHETPHVEANAQTEINSNIFF